MPPPGTGCAPLPAPLTVRLVRAEERARWQQLLAQHHYLPGARMVGEALWYVATAGAEWVAPRLGGGRAEVPPARYVDRLAPAAPVAAAPLRRQ
jgi:hypothetical protein